jgi:hypothetical protein
MQQQHFQGVDTAAVAAPATLRGRACCASLLLLLALLSLVLTSSAILARIAEHALTKKQQHSNRVQQEDVGCSNHYICNMTVKGCTFMLSIPDGTGVQWTAAEIEGCH